MDKNASSPPLRAGETVTGRHSAVPERERHPRSRRDLRHGAAIIAGWLLFGAGWVKVWGDSSPGTVGATLLLLAVTLSVSVAVTWLWIWHNEAIFRRKGPRRAARRVDFTDDQDFLGRRFNAQWSAIAASQVVLVRVHMGIKSFSTANEPETGALADSLV